MYKRTLNRYLASKLCHKDGGQEVSMYVTRVTQGLFVEKNIRKYSNAPILPASVLKVIQ